MQIEEKMNSSTDADEEKMNIPTDADEEKINRSTDSDRKEDDQLERQEGIGIRKTASIKMGENINTVDLLRKINK
jgi:hypothetical protein